MTYPMKEWCSCRELKWVDEECRYCEKKALKGVVGSALRFPWRQHTRAGQREYEKAESWGFRPVLS